MGYMQHHAIIVTGWTDRLIDSAAIKAEALGLTITSVQQSPANGYTTFLVVPDGSKEGWPASDHGDLLRDRFIEWLMGSGLTWVELQYGAEDGVAPTILSSYYDEL